MKKQSTLIVIAAVCYVGIVLFVRFHPIGRDVYLLDFGKHRMTAVISSFCMLATAATFLTGTKNLNGGETIRTGCLGAAIAAVASIVAAFIDITPDAWTPLQSQIFIRNLVTVTSVPFGIVFIFGMRRTRVGASASSHS